MVCLRRAIEILAKTGTKKLKIFPKTGSCQQPKDKQKTEKKKKITFLDVLTTGQL